VANQIEAILQLVLIYYHPRVHSEENQRDYQIPLRKHLQNNQVSLLSQCGPILSEAGHFPQAADQVQDQVQVESYKNLSEVCQQNQVPQLKVKDHLSEALLHVEDQVIEAILQLIPI